MMIQDTGTLLPQMQRWVARTISISTLIFMYLQVHEYGSCHFCARQMAICLSIAFDSPPRSPYT